jgi:hypothetical protein
MNTAQWIALALDEAIAFLQRSNQGGTTIDEAIAALEAAKTKTWEQYKAEAAAAVTPSGSTPAPSIVPPPAP